MDNNLDFILAAAALQKAGQGGGGSGLPDVTSDDNGKVLSVVGGAWNKADKSPFVVTYTITGGPSASGDYTLSYSHTLAEIAKAQDDGREVLGFVNLYGVPVSAPAIVRAAANGKMDYSGVSYSNGQWFVVMVDHGIYSGHEVAYMYLTYISTTEMNFDGSTGTLAITD